MRILDISAGRRGIWFDKAHADCVYVDRRPEVKPDIVADSRCLPFASDAAFDLVVFDPPHVNFGKNANMTRNYGYHTTADIRQIVELSAGEAHRVTRPDALMAFKWNDHDQPFDRMLGLMRVWWRPLFGTPTAIGGKRATTTKWVMLLRT